MSRLPFSRRPEHIYYIKVLSDSQQLLYKVNIFFRFAQVLLVNFAQFYILKNAKKYAIIKPQKGTGDSNVQLTTPKTQRLTKLQKIYS